MNSAVDAILDLSKEIPPDSADAPAWFRNSLSVPREEGWIDSSGCPVHYFRWGDPANPPLLLMHGFLAHSRCFAFIAPLLADNYHVVAFDFSGMGDSGTRSEYSQDSRVVEMMDVARSTGLFDHAQKPVIIAHSYGGSVGLGAMEQHAEVFSGLILCDLMCLRPDRLLEHSKDQKPPGSQDAKRQNRVYPDYEIAKGRYVLSPPQPVEERYLFDYMAFHSLKSVEGGWTWKFDPGVFAGNSGDRERLLQQGYRIADAPGRKAIVYGQDSLLFDDDSADYVRECGGRDIPMIGLPGARHHLMLDEPVAFACVLKSVLALWQVD